MRFLALNLTLQSGRVQLGSGMCPLVLQIFKVHSEKKGTTIKQYPWGTIATNGLHNVVLVTFLFQSNCLPFSAYGDIIVEYMNLADQYLHHLFHEYWMPYKNEVNIFLINIVKICH